jgi:hypothetical protein
VEGDGRGAVPRLAGHHGEYLITQSRSFGMVARMAIKNT